MAAGVVLPFALVFALFLAGSALSAIVLGSVVALLVLVLLTLGPVPALAALGNAITRSRAGLFGGFLVGAILWRAVSWLIPLLGAVVGLAVYTWGVGSWLTAGWDQRKRSLDSARLGPDLRVGDETSLVPDDWDPPLPPA